MDPPETRYTKSERIPRFRQAGAQPAERAFAGSRLNTVECGPNCRAPPPSISRSALV